jgi:alkylation response protein AidB-like acyl-CoA dehydrogenase
VSARPGIADLNHLDEGERALYERTREAGRALAPLAAAADPGRVDPALVRGLAEHGLLRRLFGDGGEGARVSAIDLCIIREALAAESTAAETAFGLQGLGAYPILLAARDHVVAEWIPRVAAGEAVAAFALTEPSAGSDAAALELAAERDGDGWRLNGTKTWISNAPDADVYTVFARTTPGSRARGVTAFVVPGDSDGLGGERLELLSEHPIGRLEFDGVRVRPEYVLGDVDAGFRVAMRTLDLFRPSVGAFAVGMAQAALEAAVEHAGRRTAFGQPLCGFQAVSHALAEMATRTQAARLLVHHAARAYDRGLAPVSRQAAMAKLFATEAAQWVVDAAVQVHGAAGLQRGHLLEHLYRDVRAPRIYEGTSEIQREIIARELYRHDALPPPPAAGT